MRNLNRKELLEIDGGASSFASSGWVTAIVKGIASIFDIGKSFGTAIRRVISKSVCSV
ncbi:MAG: hypothetical protein NC181_04885 [Clostridium sp.]|nr:hypothetical protein [Clostridium sp.]MCM1444568.1 hypothetical protein [Candidatus Amulumruptor caecigallinarius]